MTKEQEKYLPIVIALAAGGAFYFFSKKSSADVLPTGPDDKPPKLPPEKDEKTPSKKKAPPIGDYQQKLTEGLNTYLAPMVNEANSLAFDVENLMGARPPESKGLVRQAISDNIIKIPSGRTIASVFADQAYANVGGKPIPPSSKRGSGWAPWVQLWNALYGRAKGDLNWTPPRPGGLDG